MDANRDNPIITAEELSAILAHEIKNPMNSVIINVEVLKGCVTQLTDGTENPAADKARRYIDAIETEVHRLDKVIKGFLDFANPSAASKIKFKVNPLIQDLKDLIQTEIRQKNVQLTCDLQSESPCVFGNPDQIKQAVFNLLTNALQSLDDKGTVTIKSWSTDTQSLISVKDTGPGIPAEIRGKIFSPYFTTRAKGSGVGLFIVKKVVREHAGDIELRTTPGEGSEFILIFPRPESLINQ